MKKFALSLSIALAAASTGAQAADLAARPYTKAPAPILEESWAGIYLGGQVGYAWTSTSYNVLNVANGGAVDPYVPNMNSVAGGGHLGAQGQWGHWVLGVVGDYNWTSLKETDGSGGGVIPSVVNGRFGTVDIKGIGSVAGKVGYAFNNWLLYGKGGWAIADISTSLTMPTASVDKWQNGFVVGGGAELKLAHNWVLGAEFDYYDFKFDRSALGSDGSTVSWSSVHAPVFTLLFSASYLFNVGGPVIAKY
ncbi:MAG: outer membrane beta-barrel protein [Xanthobacteraceae bacterium]|nr:outer membrane beta-barrel protein [Xanthobacteraceae bacterium]